MPIKEKVNGSKTRFRERDKQKTGVIQVAEAGIGLLLGAILSSALIFGRCAPFGVAIVAAAGAGLTGFCALLGAVGGYLFFQGVETGLHYAAAAVLIYAVTFAFYDMSIGKKNWFAPGAAVLLSAVTSFVYLTGEGWYSADVIFYLTELVLIGASVYCFRGAFEASIQYPAALDKLPLGQKVGYITVGAALLVALSGIQVFGEFSIGRILAAAVVMMAARRGPNTGLLSGVVAGIVMDLSSGRNPYYSMVFAVAGLASGLAWNRSKIFTAIAYVAANGAAVLWTWETGMRIGLLYEVFTASVLFMIIPHRIGEPTSQVLVVQKPGNLEWERAKHTAVQHMQTKAKAFRDLYESIRDTFRPDRSSSEDVAVIFQCTAERQCRRCTSRDTCWSRDYQSTQQALNDATRTMMDRGRAAGEDFPSYFRSRCIHFPEFLAIVNEELTAFLYRRQMDSRLRESRAALCRQYAEIDQILGAAATELAAEITPDLPRQKKLKQYLRSQGLEDEGAVYYDEKGHLKVETPVSEALRATGSKDALAKALNIILRDPEELEERLVFSQAEPFVATASVAGRSKEGEQVSGDTGTWFRRPDGLLCILLCDGMGSGPEARKESGVAVRLLQNFLKAGVEPEAALCTVNSALALKGEETGGCTTVDLLTVELYTGLCSVYKFGAAPTFLRKQDRVSCITGSTLPAGIMAGDDVKPDITRFRAEDEDWIVLLSDGVISGDDDAWMRSYLTTYEGKSPGELADRLLELSVQENEGADDSTVIAVRLEKRK